MRPLLLAPVLWLLMAGAAGGQQAIRVVQVERLPTPLAGEWHFRPGHDPAWASPFRERRGWQVISVPGSWERQGNAGYDGHAWFRLHLFLSSALAGKDIGLDLGTIGDVDEVFLNGRPIGATGGFPPRFDRATLSRRFYRLPREMIRFGDRNELAIHVYNETRYGGLLGPPPRVDHMESIRARRMGREILLFSLAVFLAAMAALHLWLFSRDRRQWTSLMFTLFASACAAYVLTLAELGGIRWVGHAGAHRGHVALLLTATALVPPLVFRIARQGLPLPLYAMQGLLGLGAVFSLVWRTEADLFPWLVVGYVAVVVLGVLFLHRILGMIRHRRPWAFSLLVVTGLLTTSALADIVDTLAGGPRRGFWLLEAFSPLALPPFGAVLCLGLLQIWIHHRCGEPGERGSGLITWDRFLETVDREMERSRRTGNPLTVSLLRITRGGLSAVAEPAVGEAVETLRRSLRHMDTMARMENETLGLLLPETEERTAMATLERLRRSVGERFTASGSRLNTTAGVAEFRPVRHITTAELVEEAEAALYAALNEGGDCTATAP